MATAEIVSIGTELLLGDVLDTNSQFLSTELAALGIDCLHRSTVGDNSERIIGALKLALSRADLVITTGGLGPTADDLTHECIAAIFGGEMDFDEPTLLRIQAFFKQRGVVMVDSNRKQAYRPKHSKILFNPVGTAPGIMFKLEEELLHRANLESRDRPRWILTFPGVPSEMKAMWAQTARPFIASEFESAALFSCELKHYGIGESTLAEKYGDLLNSTNPTVAPLAGTGECRLRVTAKGKTLDEAKSIAAETIDTIRKQSGELCYGIDDETLESVVGDLLKRSGKTVCVAESCTGGLVSKRLTDVPGSSAYVKLNLVTYANEAKEKILGVSPDLLLKFGAVSAECAEQMALGAAKIADSDFALSITGVAGPDGGTLEKPVGLVYFALAAKDSVQVVKRQFPEQLGRQGIRQRSASEALNILRLHLLQQ